MRLSIIAAALVALIPAVAWPCSGQVCDRRGQGRGWLVLIDGGVPANYPLLLGDLWDPNSFVPQVDLQLFEDGGQLPTQQRTVDSATLVLDTSSLVVGERYQVRHRTGCVFPTSMDIFLEDVLALPARPLLTQGVSIELDEVGTGLVPQYSGSTCSEGVPSSYARFRFAVDPAAAELVQFYGWHLSLQPSDGGPSLAWQSESVGVMLPDGGLRVVPNMNLAPRRISLVYTACGGPQFNPGAPPGRYRAVLSARLAGTDAGFDDTSDEFELLPCTDVGGDGGVLIFPDGGSGFDGGTDAGSRFDGGSGGGSGGGNGSDGGGFIDGGSLASTDGGTVLGPSADRGCSVGGGTTLLLLALLALRRRR